MAKSLIPAPATVPRLVPSLVGADPAVLARESTAHADAILRQTAQVAAAQDQANATDQRVTALTDPVAAITFNVKQFGAVGDGSTDDTAAIQRALDAAASAGGGFAAGVRGSCVYLPVSPTPYMFSSLLLPGYVALIGEHMSGCRLMRIPGSTGPAIREKNLAEDPSGAGASGVWLRHLRVDGNSTAGDGVYLGFQVGGAQFNFLAGLENVFVNGFTSGTGVKLNANAISCRYVWSNSNQTGFSLQGGGNVYHSLWAEQNSGNDLVVAGQGDAIFGVQTEPIASTTASVLVTGSDNVLCGVYVGLQGNKNEVVKNATGANRNVYRDVMCVANGHTFTHVILNEPYVGASTGSANFHIQEYVIGEGSGVARWYVNQSTGKFTTTIADATVVQGTLQVGASVPNIVGSRGGNAALASLLTALATEGLITDGTTP